MAGQIVTAERLREVLHYDPLTGVFTWIAKTNKYCNRVAIGDIAGSKKSGGYFQIQVDGHRSGAHILAWLYMTGEWPEDQIDHRDTDPSNNRWDNLRSATNAQNQQNQRKARSDNKTGFLGVNRSGRRYQSSIRVDGKKVHLGRFETPELAHAAYLEAKTKLHPFQTLVATTPGSADDLP